MLSKAQEAYLAGAPPSYPAIEAIVTQGHSEEVLEWPGHHFYTWREHARVELEERFLFAGHWLNGPEAHNLLLGLPLKPAFRVYLEESVLWLQADTQLVGIGGGFQPGTRILVLPKNAEAETTLHEIGHVGYQAWLYQVPELHADFMTALREYARWGQQVGWTPYAEWPVDVTKRPLWNVWAHVWGYVNEGWDVDNPAKWSEGFLGDWNPDEAFASLFSACRGRMELLPPGLGVFYRGMVGG